MKLEFKKYSFFLIYLLPGLLESIVSPYVDGNLFKFYITKTSISPVDMGKMGTIIGFFSWFFSYYVSSFVSIFGQKTIILLGSPILSFIMYLYFHPIQAYPKTFYVILSCLKIIPLNLCYSAILYKVKDVKSRQELLGLRSFMNNIGGMIGNAMLIWIDFNRWLFVFCCLICGAYYVLVVFLYVNPKMLLTKEEKSIGKKKLPSSDTISLFLQVKSQQPFWYLFLYKMFNSFRSLFFAESFPLYLIHVLQLHNEEEYNSYLGYLNLTNTITSLLSTPFWIWMCKKIGTKRSLLINYFFQLVLGSFVFLIYWSGGYKKQLYFFANLLVGFFSNMWCFFVGNVQAMVFDYDALVHDRREEVGISAIWELFSKYFELPGSSISLFLLNTVGSYNILEKNSVQEDGTRLFINVQATLFPALTGFVCFYFLYKFGINDKVHSEIIQQIKNRKEGKKVMDPITGKEILKKIEKKTTFLSKFSRRVRVLGIIVGVILTLLSILLAVGMEIYEMSENSLNTTLLFVTASVFLTFVFMVKNSLEQEKRSLKKD